MAGEHAPPPVAPTIAAQKLRLLSRSILNIVLSPPNVMNQSVREAAAIYRSAAQKHAFEVDSQMQRVVEAAKTRKVSDVAAAVEQLRIYLVRERSNNRSVYDTFTSTSTTAFGFAKGDLPTLQHTARQVVDLVQSLPTSEDMPRGNMENMLRAIMAILRTGGYPGAENLIWEEVKKNAEKESNGSVAATEESGAESSPGSEETHLPIGEFVPSPIQFTSSPW